MRECSAIGSGQACDDHAGCQQFTKDGAWHCIPTDACTLLSDDQSCEEHGDSQQCHWSTHGDTPVCMSDATYCATKTSSDCDQTVVCVSDSSQSVCLVGSSGGRRRECSAITDMGDCNDTLGMCAFKNGVCAPVDAEL